jgi:hypothetical protein
MYSFGGANISGIGSWDHEGRRIWSGSAYAAPSRRRKLSLGEGHALWRKQLGPLGGNGIYAARRPGKSLLITRL